MTAPSSGPDGGDVAPAARRGCFAAVAFVLVAVIVWIAAIIAYGLVVEQWEMVRVRREFSYDWAFLYAPLLAIGCGTAVAFWTTRRTSAAWLAVLVVVAAVVALFGGVVLFGLGAIM